MKRFIKIIIPVLCLVIGLAIGIFSTYLIMKNNKDEDSNTLNTSTKLESPYTLEEIYDIIEDPERYYEENKGNPNDFAYTLFHFYDYFSINTPFKIATKVELDDDNYHVSKVLEVDYLTYSEYMDAMKVYYEEEQWEIDWCKEEKNKDLADCNDEKYVTAIMNYKRAINWVVYGR